MMKKLILCVSIVALIFTACKKDYNPSTAVATINVVNSVVNLNSAKSNFMGGAATVPFSQLTTNTSYGSNTVYSVFAERSYPLIIVNSADTTKTITKTNIDFKKGDIYTLYLSGNSTAIDTIMRKETVPSFRDSSCAVRFINLSYNSNPIKINLTNSPTIDEAGTLNYRQQSTFKVYRANKANSSYSFQVRDASTNSVLVTYTLTVPRFFSCTLAWIGQKGVTGNNAPKIQRINNY